MAAVAEIEVESPKPQCVQVENVGAWYTRGEPVLQDVSFSISVGEAVALLGHNGSGKSTLIRCLTGLMNVQHGNISLFEIPLDSVSKRKQQELRRKVGVVYQKHNLVPRLSVLSNVIHGALARDRSPRLWFQSTAPKQYRHEAMDILDRVGLAPFAERKAGQLSGGQSQRVALARALMQQPKLILADEPVASLDPQAGEEIMQLLHQLCKQEEVTLVFSTHHLDHATQYSDSLVALKGGVVFASGPSATVSQESLKRIYE